MDQTPSSAARAAANQTPKPNAREATEQNIPPAQIPIQTAAIGPSDAEFADMIERATSPITTRPSVSFREIQNLQSANLPGRLEINAPPQTRKRCPSYQKARYMYNEILKALNAEMTSFEAKEYHNMSYEALLKSNIRPHYRKLRQRQQALLIAADDLIPILEKDGMINEQRTLKEDIDSVSTQMIAIKFSFGDSISIGTESNRRES